MRRLLFVLALLAPLPALGQPLFAAADTAPQFLAENGEVTIQLDQTLLDSVGLKLEQIDGKGRLVSADSGQLRFDLAGRVRFESDGDAIARFTDHSLKLAGGLRATYRGRQVDILGLSIEPDPVDTTKVSLFDAAGRRWFTGDHAHHHIYGSVLELKHLGLIGAEAFDEWLGLSAFQRSTWAELSLKSPLLERPDPTQIESCASPNWPNTAGAPGGGLWRADVLLESMGTLQGGGCTGGCDGPGGAGTGMVKFTPSATLRNSNNADTAEVPWYGMFTTPSPPYNNDQHPFLVWHLYRIDPNGRLVQIARSGVKHAFYTINIGCAEPCNSSGRILGRGCGDVYDTGTNNSPSTLGARNEIVPAKGIWGRCGSTRDPNCQGTNGGNSITAFQLRALAPENELDPSLNAGSQYFFDGWYIVRDDVNIYNTMGSQGFTPVYQSSTWASSALTPFVRGAMIDRWVDPNVPTANRFSTVIATADGQFKAAVRVDDLGNSRWRYSYAIMNFDFARATISGNAPNQRVENPRGVIAARFGKGSDATIDNLWFFDGDGNPANDWSAAVTPGAIEFRRESGNDLTWGGLYSFGFESNSPPSFGGLNLIPGRDLPASLDHITLTPAGQEPALFANAFD